MVILPVCAEEVAYDEVVARFQYSASGRPIAAKYEVPIVVDLGIARVQGMRPMTRCPRGITFVDLQSTVGSAVSETRHRCAIPSSIFLAKSIQVLERDVERQPLKTQRPCLRRLEVPDHRIQTSVKAHGP